MATTASDALVARPLIAPCLGNPSPAWYNRPPPRAPAGVMILSHRHRFIFIKTTKTAGTSVEIALSRLCGPEDIITPLAPRDEILRRQWQGRGPQHHLKPLSAYTPRDWWRWVRRRQRVNLFYNHMSAREIRRLVGPDIWNGYFKFCFERNPWDRVISYYYWRRQRRGLKLSLEEFIHSDELLRLKATGWGLYTLDGEVAVDRLCRYENLQEELSEVLAGLGLDAPASLPRAKADLREDRRPYQRVLGPAERERIEEVFADEIALLGYRF